jgi:hypothetical protein
MWFDRIRGIAFTFSSQTTGASTDRTGIGWTNSGCTTNSFTVDRGTNGNSNANGNSHASWSWRGSDSSAVSNTEGSITSTVSANTTSGFSIVSWTGTGANATVGHGLGVAPKMIIIKDRSNTRNWQVYHAGYGNTGSGQLNLTNAFSADGMFQNTTPTSSVFSVGTSVNVNASGANIIAYCFADVKGYSKFGSYTGNGNNDGTFVYTGFKPAFVLSKCSSAAGEDWNLNDNKRPGFNVIQNALLANSTSAEVTASYQALDFTSNGFKWRGSNDRVNGSGKTYIYMAIAENPFVTSTSIPTTAR